jgi:DNA modification methylase
MFTEDTNRIYYQTTNLTLYYADCLDLMRSMDDGSIDLTVTSPPYDNLRNYNGYSFPFLDVAKELYRVTKPGGIVIWNVNDRIMKGSRTGTSARQALAFMELGFNWHDTMIYHKLNPLPATRNDKRYHQAWEPVFCFSRGRPKTFNPIIVPAKRATAGFGTATRCRKDGSRQHERFRRNKETMRQNVFSYAIGNGSTTKDRIAFEHPALMPEKLAQDQIFTWSNPGDLVFDPFAGACTTGKMAALLNRRFIGSEVSRDYCDIAAKRLAPCLEARLPDAVQRAPDTQSHDDNDPEPSLW